MIRRLKDRAEEDLNPTYHSYTEIYTYVSANLST